MLRRLLNNRVTAEERRLGVPLHDMRLLAAHAPYALLKFALFSPLARHRGPLPAEVYHTARLVAARSEDCGSCVQIAVNMARQSGVPPDVIRAILDDRLDALPPACADALRFARAVCTHTDPGVPCDALRKRFGEAGLVALALAVATTRVFPTVNRALGFATACARGALDVEDAAPVRTAALTRS